MAIPVVIAATIVVNEGISGVVLFAGPEIHSFLIKINPFKEL